MRIVSLLPAATEVICGLGLAEQLVGVSHECDYPAAVRSLPKVTRTKIRSEASSQQIDAQVREQLQSESSLYSLDVDTIGRLKPDLIVTQTLCNVCAVAESEISTLLKQLDNVPQVVNLAPTRLSDIFDGIAMIAAASGIEARGERWITQMQAQVQSIAVKAEQASQRPRVLLLEWLDPLFCAGHWSPELVKLAGGDEVIGVAGQVSHCVSWDEVYESDPDILVVACCGFDVARTTHEFERLDDMSHFAELRCVRDRRAYIVDGNAYFNRPGPRLLDSLQLLAHLFHADVFSLPRHVISARPLSLKAGALNRHCQ